MPNESIRCECCDNRQFLYNGYLSNRDGEAEAMLKCEYCGNNIFYKIPDYLPKEQILKYLRIIEGDIYERQN